MFSSQQVSESGDELGSGCIVAGKYRLDRYIASGGMGEVYEARHQEVGRRVAIKFMKASRSRDPHHVARFEREARISGGLQHEHIVSVHDMGTHNQRPFIVMDLVDGESLAALIRRDAPLSVPRTAELARQAALALQYAHSEGVIHRDLKPDNLIVSARANGRDWLRVLDFGIARLEDSMQSANVTRTGAVLGTPHYMSPEQAQDSGEVGPQADVYALGAILYEMLAGRKAHPGTSANNIIGHILLEEITPLTELRPGLPSRLYQVVGRALARGQNQRYQTMAELHAALTPFASAADAGVNSASETTGTLSTSPTPRAKLRPLFLVATVLSLSIGFFLGKTSYPTTTMEPEGVSFTTREPPASETLANPNSPLVKSQGEPQAETARAPSSLVSRETESRATSPAREPNVRTHAPRNSKPAQGSRPRVKARVQSSPEQSNSALPPDLTRAPTTTEGLFKENPYE